MSETYLLEKIGDIRDILLSIQKASISKPQCVVEVAKGDIMRVISGHLNACQRLVQTLPGDHENTYILVFEDIQ